MILPQIRLEARVAAEAEAGDGGQGQERFIGTCLSDHVDWGLSVQPGVRELQPRGDPPRAIQGAVVAHGPQVETHRLPGHVGELEQRVGRLAVGGGQREEVPSVGEPGHLAQ